MASKPKDYQQSSQPLSRSQSLPNLYPYIDKATSVALFLFLSINIYIEVNIITLYNFIAGVVLKPMPLEFQNLQSVLENAHKGFAYELLALEIQIQNNKDEKGQSLITNLSKLIQLYMLGVQVLESHWDNRYKYFNDKIQGLMKKKHIIEELHFTSTGNNKIPTEALAEVNRQLRDTRKNDHEINIFINAQQCDIRKVKQIVQKEQAKLVAFQNRLKKVLDTQQGKINERIQRRKMKSQCHSKKFDIGSNAPNERLKEIFNDFDEPMFDKNKSKVVYKGQRRGSTQKKKLDLKL